MTSCVHSRRSEHTMAGGILTLLPLQVRTGHKPTDGWVDSSQSTACSVEATITHGQGEPMEMVSRVPAAFFPAPTG